ncbi:probable LRR receptor-like serine/threonine-protein kinase RKF3 [Andrographis paniculata]|uniref:probable LRR receptor-like serine/threonine-protein kinase RKF3 n=1 Tax=Andrographis paniculata TaxID=175694 RepID=UPI0021E9673F|nr:probable LRR receptor-like serine/threonine-protein kinase RKF3 [Andrographis paniculata]
MSRFVYLLLLQLLFTDLFTSSASLISDGRVFRRNLLQNGTVSSRCPLNFDVLRRLDPGGGWRPNLDSRLECQYALQGLRLVLSEHLRLTGIFLPPIETAEACWDSYDKLVDGYVPNFDVRRRCSFQTPWISTGCMNITTRVEFESLVPPRAAADVVSACNQSLLNNSPCASCITAISAMQASLAGPSAATIADCTALPLIYAAAFGNHFGPTDAGTAKCLFNLNFSPPKSNTKSKTTAIAAAVSASTAAAILLLLLLCYLRRRRKPKFPNSNPQINLTSGLNSINQSTTLIQFKFDEIKSATNNFSRNNIIGKGGYGNVYKGILPDGSEVALKRFKNCSAAGDAIFTHEVEVIASVRHVNLVALRGYCTATTPLEGHQRIIVCDLMKNGSLHDHLFGLSDRKLGWPARQRIAIGTAKGLEYLHYGAQPGIIHRDIKSSNILLDEKFEPKVADFGLAKFAPEGMTHLSTRVAGTMGYVAPEYALYGQLTERSDVYSFGVVLLELLSGKKALMAVDDGQPTLVTDWAWSMVRKGRAMDVVEEGMPELGPADVLEKYILVAVLCSHPQLYARPTMDQVVKMLDVDTAEPVPSIPERPISLIANMADIERSANSSESGRLSTPGGYQAYTFDKQSVEAVVEVAEKGHESR